VPGEIRDACGVFAVAGHPEAARLTLYGLYALQHRGQESAGVAVVTEGRLDVRKGMGLVSEALDATSLCSIESDVALGHVRYSTFGESSFSNAQPLFVRFRKGGLAIAHNGNLVNAVKLRRELEDSGSIFQTTVDTEVLAHLIARLGRNGLEEAIVESLRRVRGGYALVLMTGEMLAAARDPQGIRPLSIGRLDGGHVFASESCAFDTIGAEFVRDVNPGELVIVDRSGMKSVRWCEPAAERLCMFEYIYFARPDSNLRGLNVHAVRKELGRRLAREAPAEADLVTGVPDSSLSAASGFAEEAGIPYEMGLVKNRYVGRTFIQPSQEQRSFGVALKLNPLRKVIEGKRVVLVDDSIVRGTTSRRIVRLLREAGASEVHLRISSSPYRYPCYFGIDTSARGELVASSADAESVRRVVGADTLHYLSLDGMAGATGRRPDDFCLACFSGEYPVDVADGARYFWEEAERPPSDGEEGGGARGSA